MGNEFGKTLAMLRKQVGYKQHEVSALMEKRGYPITKQSISRWEKGINLPNALQFIGLCAIYHVQDVPKTFDSGRLPTYADMLNRDGREKVDSYVQDLIASGLYAIRKNVISFPKRSLPMYDLPASAGTGQFLDSSSYEIVEVGDDVPMSANFGVRISGDSMEPRYHDGGVVWVQQQPTLEDGQVGVFLYEGNAYLKLLQHEKKRVQLISLNDAYQPITIHADSDFKVFGKVVN